MSSRKSIIAYCALSMGFSMLSSSFNFYYVKVFLNLYHIKESWFHFAQILYMVWNAVNDPLFAMCQDNTKCLLTRTRREGILYTAPLFGLAFLVAWIPMGDSPVAVGIHLIAALFLYDTMFTFIGLLSCCLFTELSSDPHNRLKLTRYSTVASMIGAQSILFLEFASDSLNDFHSFQIAAVFVACCGTALMMFTGCHAHTKYDERESERKFSEAEGAKEKVPKEKDDSSIRKMLQIFKEKNFIVFVITNFFQEFHRAFWGGFLAILCEYLVVTDQVPASVRSFFYGVTGTAGGILVILITPLVGQIGYFRTIRYNFVWKILGGLTMYFVVGPGNSWIIMLYILIDRAFANATFSFFNMPLSDIADVDKAKYNRRQPISSTVFGSNALVVKPAQSLSPMLVVNILNRWGYEQLKDQKDLTSSSAERESLTVMMFQLICFYPVVLGVIQFFVWSQYSIRRSITKSSELEETCSQNVC